MIDLEAKLMEVATSGQNGISLEFEVAGGITESLESVCYHSLASGMDGW